MNKIHRTVWSEARQCFVVASETAKAKGKASSSSAGVVSAVAAALMALSANSASAADICGVGLTTISTVQASGDNCNLAAGDSVLITSPNGKIAPAANYGISVFSATNVGGITNAGTISGGSFYAINIGNASLINGISNSGKISGAGIVAAATDATKFTTIAGGIVNSGVIEGTTTSAIYLRGNKTVSGFVLTGGIYNTSGATIQSPIATDVYAIQLKSNSTVTGGITNAGTITGRSNGAFPSLMLTSGVISGTTYYPVLDGITIAGSNTAKFVGEVSAKNVPVVLAADAIYTMDSPNALQKFSVGTFTNAGTLKIGTTTTGQILDANAGAGGNFTNSGTFSSMVASDSSSFGKLSVARTATLPTSAIFEVIHGDGNIGTCSGIAVGGTLAGVISATTLTWDNTYVVTDNCTNVDFQALRSGQNVNLVAIAPPVVSHVVTSATNDVSFGTVSCAGSVVSGGTATCTGTPSVGYYLASAAGCGTASVSGTTITAGPVTAACTVTGTFALTAVNGTCSGTNGSTVTSAPAASCLAGTPSSVSTGITAYSWTCAGIGVGTPDSCSATRNYVVSSSAGANGSISTSQNVAYNATPSFTVAANSGYTIQSVTGCSGTLSGGNYTTAAIVANCAVSASFVANVAPTFIGATTTLTVVQSAAATDVKGFLHASDSDASQTLTWTQNAAPTHGTLSITSATAASGSADVTPGGTITYAPTAGYVGSDSFTVQVSDGTATATRSISVTVSAPTVTVGALTLNSMTVGTVFVSQSFAGAGGYGAYTYTVSAGSLPAGLSLNASTGALSGTPTTAGAYSFTIRAVDSSTGTGAPFAGTQAFSGTVAAANTAPTFVGATTALTVAQGASATDVKSLLHASDSDASQTLTWTQNAAPTHGTLSITSATAASGSADVTPGGTITYTPTAGYAGADAFTVQVSDGTATATRSISVTVSAPTVTVGALTLNSMTVGTVFVSQSFAGAGGYGAYTYSVSAGTLPAGLSLNASTGALSGTPTTAGAYSFTIRAVDSSTGTGAPFAGTQAFSGTVAAANTAPTFVGATTALTVAQGASAADVKSLLHASDSDASQTLTWTQNAAPTHGTLAITSATAASGSTDVTPGGTITYQPTAGYAGADSFIVQVSDGTANASRTINVTISPPTVTVNALTLNTMTVGTAYVSQTFSATGGTAPYTYTVSAGALPAGLSLNASTGALTGTPTTAGAYSFTIQAADSTTGTHGSGTRTLTGSVVGSTSQSNIPTSTTGVTANLAVAGCSGVTSAVFVAAPSGAPANTTFPYGLLDFTLNGCSGSSVTVTVTYSQPIPSGALFYKAVNGVYSQYNYLNATTVGTNSVTFTLVDGGSGDDDGAANGSIHDPSGLGVPATTTVEPIVPEVPVPLIPPLASLPALPGVGNSGRTFLNLAEGAGPSMTGCLRTTLNDILGPDWLYQGQSADGGSRLSRATEIISFYPIEANTNTTYGLGQGAGIYLRTTNPLSVVTGCGTFVTAPALYSLGEFGALLNAAGQTAQINAQGVITYPTGSLTYAVRPDYLVTQGTPGAPALSNGADGQLRFTDSAGHVQILYPAFLEPETLGSQVAQAVGGWTVIQTDGTALVTLLNGQKFVLTPDLALGTVPPEIILAAWWQDGPNHYRFRHSGFSNTSQGFSVSPR